MRAKTMASSTPWVVRLASTARGRGASAVTTASVTSATRSIPPAIGRAYRRSDAAPAGETLPWAPGTLARGGSREPAGKGRAHHRRRADGRRRGRACWPSAGADVAFTYRLSADAAERAAVVVGARSAGATRCTPTSATHWSAGRRSTKPRRRSAGSTSWSTWPRLYKHVPFDDQDAGPLGPPAVGGSAGGVPVQPRRGAAHAPRRRRPHRQLLGLDRGQRPSALPRATSPTTWPRPA